jgi:hypothetical protein
LVLLTNREGLKMAITKKEGAKIGTLLNSTYVAIFALEDAKEEDKQFWMNYHDKACDELEKYHIFISKYSFFK